MAQKLFRKYILVISALYLITEAFYKVKASNVFDKKTLQVISNIYVNNDSNIIFLSETFSPRVPEKFQQKFAIAHISDMKILNSSTTDHNKIEKMIVVVSFPNISETLNITSQLISSVIRKEIDFNKISILICSQIAPSNKLDSLSSAKTLIEENPSFLKSLNELPPLYSLFLLLINSSDGITLNDTYKLHEFYKINNEIIMRLVNEISSDEIYPKRTNLHGLTLNVSGFEDITTYNDDTIFLKTNKTTKVELADCFSGRILQIFKDSLNMSVNIRKSDAFGVLNENGSWDGTINDVISKKYDLGFSAILMIPSRVNVIGYLPASEENYLLAFFQPPELNAIRDIFMQPFQKTLWAAVFGTWFTLAIAMITFTLIRKKFKVGQKNKDKNIKNNNSNDEEPDLSGDSFILMLATATQQGWDEHPHALSLRTIFISASITGVIAYAGYSAAIVSTLSLRIDPIQSPEALISSNLKLSIRSGAINDLLLKADTEDIVRKIYNRAFATTVEANRLVNVTRGIELIRKSAYAFVSTKTSFYDISKVSLNNSDICGIKELPILKYGFKMGMFTRKNSPFRELFRKILILIRERGVLWRLNDEFAYRRRCIESSDNTGRALGANDVFTAFMIILGGYVLSLFFLLIEIFIYRKFITYIQ